MSDSEYRTWLLITAGPDETGSLCRVGKGAHLILRRACPTWGARLEGLRAVPTRGHVAGASAGSFAHPTIQCEWDALYPTRSSSLMVRTDRLDREQAEPGR